MQVTQNLIVIASFGWVLSKNSSLSLCKCYCRPNHLLLAGGSRTHPVFSVSGISVLIIILVALGIGGTILVLGLLALKRWVQKIYAR